MIADKTIVLYNSQEKKVIAEIQAGWEYHSNAEVFEGTLDEFKEEFPEFQEDGYSLENE